MVWMVRDFWSYKAEGHLVSGPLPGGAIGLLLWIPLADQCKAPMGPFPPENQPWLESS